jgi:hypothetical protein
MKTGNENEPRIEPAPSSETKGDARLAFFIAAAICIASGITGLKTGNPGGYVALGMGALSTLGALRS